MIRDVLIPKIFGREISEQERALFSLPLRFGGMGIQNPVEISDSEFTASAAITRNLTDLILQQKSDLNLLDRSEMARVKASILQRRNESFNEHYDELKSKEEDSKFLELAREKGSFIWLSALPLKRLGYVLNKQSFRDAVRLRFFLKKRGGGALTQHTRCRKNTGIDKMSFVLSEGSPLECYMGLCLARTPKSENNNLT